MENKNKLSLIILAGYTAVIAAVLLIFLRLIPWLWPFLSSLVLAFIFKSLARKFNSTNRFAAAAAGIVFYGAVILLFWFFTALLLSALVNFSKQLPGFYIEQLLPWAENISNRLLSLINRFAPASALSLGEIFSYLSLAAQELVTELSAAFISWVTGFLKRLPIFLIGFVFMIISSLSIAADYDRVTQFLMRQLPHKLRPMMYDIKNFLISCLFKLIKAYAIIMVITFSELCIGLWTLRISGFYKYAAIITLLDVLPVLGAGAALVPWGAAEIIGGNVALGTGLIILYCVILLVRNIIEPHVVGDSLDLHPVVTLASMFFGLRAMGIGGMIAAPIIVLLIKFLNDNKKINFYR